MITGEIRMLKIDPTARVSPLADIEESVRGTLIEIGPRTVIDSFVKIKPAGGAGQVVIGADCAINSGTVIYTGNGVRIGDAVLIAANCTLAPTNHAFADPSRRIP
jgi:acetyltransferase-like isoleucine patch superfamily enzyme